MALIDLAREFRALAGDLERIRGQLNAKQRFASHNARPSEQPEPRAEAIATAAFSPKPNLVTAP